MENAAIGKQYSKWVYPKPIDDVEAEIARGSYQYADPALFFHIFFPEREISPLNMLVAGCGTHQSAFLAYSNPDSKITAIDISETSIEHTLYLKQKHNLKNLEVLKLSLFDVGELGETFDFITCTGVLHHLPDPVAGCRALADVLDPDGVMTLMLYATANRVGVYLLQEAFQALQLGQTDEDVQLMKACMKSLPQAHSVRSYLASTNDLDFDGGWVDTFLNPQDVSYNVKEVLQFVENAGLMFHSWLDNGDYAVQNFFTTRFAGYEKLIKCDRFERALFVDNFLQKRGTHRFNVCHREKTGHEFTIDAVSLDTLIPRHRGPIKILETADKALGKPAQLERSGHKFALGGLSMEFFQHINTEDSLARICEKVAANTRSDIHSVRESCVEFFSDYHERGHVMFQKRAL